MIRYPTKAVRTIGFLKSQYNEIEIYVEDTTTTAMYLLIFRQILGSKVHLKSVTPVGDRNRVLAACRLDQANDGRKKLYLIDDDFDHFAGRYKPKLRHLYRLRAYCVENILLDETAVINVGVEDDTNATEQEVSKRLNFKPWLTETVAALLPLFIVYAAARELQPSLQTVGYTVVRLCDQTAEGLRISRSKVRARMREVIRGIKQVEALAKYCECRRQITMRIRDNSIPGERLISGKSYIFPLLISRMESVVSHRGRAEQLKVRLARNYNPEVEPWLARRIRSLCKITDL